MEIVEQGRLNTIFGLHQLYIGQIYLFYGCHDATGERNTVGVLDNSLIEFINVLLVRQGIQYVTRYRRL